MEHSGSWATLEELSHHFSDEHTCVSYLYKIKWPHEFRCPRCHYSHAYVISTRRLPLYECSACQHQTSLTADTIMENSRTSLVKWITTIWLVSQHHMTINAVQLSSIIQVTYKTAWSMLHKVRAVISAIDSDSPLEGTIQGVVEYHAKPPPRAVYELSSREIPLIVAASVSFGQEIINLKIKKVDRQLLISKSLHPAACSQFIEHHTCANVADITIIKQPFRTIQFAYLKKQFQRARRWMIDTFHGIGSTYLQRYLDEFCFRSNASSEHFSAWDLLMSLSLSTRYGSISKQNLISTIKLAA